MSRRRPWHQRARRSSAATLTMGRSGGRIQAASWDVVCLADFRMPPLAVEPRQLGGGEGRRRPAGSSPPRTPGSGTPRLSTRTRSSRIASDPRQRRELLAAHPPRPVAAPLPRDRVVLAAQPLPRDGSRTGRPPCWRITTSTPIASERHHLVERAVVAVGQHDVAPLQPAVQRADQGHLAGQLPLAGPMAASSTPRWPGRSGRRSGRSGTRSRASGGRAGGTRPGSRGCRACSPSSRRR